MAAIKRHRFECVQQLCALAFIRVGSIVGGIYQYRPEYAERSRSVETMGVKITSFIYRQDS